MVKTNIVKKVVAENIKFEKPDKTNVRLPKNVVKMLVPVITSCPGFSEIAPPVKPL